MGGYDMNTFCDLFTTIFNIELNKFVLNDLERSVFYELEKYTARFSPYEQDLKQFPDVFYAEETLRKQIDIAVKKLGVSL